MKSQCGGSAGPRNGDRSHVHHVCVCVRGFRLTAKRAIERVRRIEPDHFDSIQVLRGMAALLVLFYHEGLFLGGFGGVDLFFIISGFVIAKVGNEDSPREFMAKRLIRIVPLYWAVTIGMYVMSFVPGLLTRFTSDQFRLSASLFFVPHFDPAGMVWPLVVPGWTLNYEMFFYIAFAAFLLLRRTSLLPIGLALLVAIGLLAKPTTPIGLTYTSPLLLEFASGLLLARTQSAPRAMGLTLLVAGVLLFVCGTAFVTDEMQFDRDRVLWLGVPALAIVAGAVSLERVQAWPRLPFLERLGDASYSLYLLHGIVIAFVHKVVSVPVLNTTLALLLSFAAAFLSYRYFERPIARALRPLLPSLRLSTTG
jgi:exopolysaccharide production protein ExoZ